MYLEQMNPYSVSKQHKRNKLHIAERIALLFDRDTFCEYYPLDFEESEFRGYDGVITGYGMISGRKVYFYGQDFTYMGGTFGYQHSMQIIAIIDKAVEDNCPVIGVFDGGGARIQEGAASVAGCASLFHTSALASGKIPQIAVIAGTCAGGAVYLPGIADFVFTIDRISNMFVTGAKVINEVQGTDYLIEELGGAAIHAQISGVAHFRMDSEESCFCKVKDLLDLIESRREITSIKEFVRVKGYEQYDLTDITELMPKDIEEPYDVREVINKIVDRDSFIEVHEEFAQNMVAGFARIGSIPVGIIANQTICKNGSVDVDAAEKAVHLVSFCNDYQIPVITFTDATGFVMEAEQEHKGLIRHGATMIKALSSATTVKLTVILRKAYGGPFILMSCKQLGANQHYVWPDSQVAVMKAEGAVAVIRHSQLGDLEGKEREAYLKEQLELYRTNYMNCNVVLGRHFVDAKLEPKDTRDVLYHDLIKYME